MKFLIVTHVLHSFYQGKYWAYSPYVREMNLWSENVDCFLIVAPCVFSSPTPIDLPYISEEITFFKVPSFNLTSAFDTFKSIFYIPKIMFKIFISMFKCDHIHLRCPGNMGLLGCFLQIFFPFKKKTAKYAGNWDSKSKQPWSYRLQKSILRNTFLSRNMKVLVYGEWDEKSSNIIPFFTASYSENDKLAVSKPNFKKVINLIFVGALISSKRPLLSLMVLHKLLTMNFNSRLVFCGEGPELKNLESYIKYHNLESNVSFLGNIDSESVKNEYCNSHFLVFGSQSEGWPKVVAEAMWWGCVPVTTAVSCVPQMLDYGNRGVLCAPSPEIMTSHIVELVKNPDRYNNMSSLGIGWSRLYTLEKFKSEIKKLI